MTVFELRKKNVIQENHSIVETPETRKCQVDCSEVFKNDCFYYALYCFKPNVEFSTPKTFPVFSIHRK